MPTLRPTVRYTLLALFVWLGLVLAGHAIPHDHLYRHSALFAEWRWWEETLQWVRSFGWDRGRLVQLWLLFVLIGLYIILRIKPRA